MAAKIVRTAGRRTSAKSFGSGDDADGPDQHGWLPLSPVLSGDFEEDVFELAVVASYLGDVDTGDDERAGDRRSVAVVDLNPKVAVDQPHLRGSRAIASVARATSDGVGETTSSGRLGAPRRCSPPSSGLGRCADAVADLWTSASRWLERITVRPGRGADAAPACRAFPPDRVRWSARRGSRARPT